MGYWKKCYPKSSPSQTSNTKSFLKKAVVSVTSRRILDGLTAQGNDTGAVIPADIEQDNGADEDGETENGEAETP